MKVKEKKIMDICFVEEELKTIYSEINSEFKNISFVITNAYTHTPMFWQIEIRRVVFYLMAIVFILFILVSPVRHIVLW